MSDWRPRHQYPGGWLPRHLRGEFSVPLSTALKPQPERPRLEPMAIIAPDQAAAPAHGFSRIAQQGASTRRAQSDAIRSRAQSAHILALHAAILDALRRSGPLGLADLATRLGTTCEPAKHQQLRHALEWLRTHGRLKARNLAAADRPGYRAQYQLPERAWPALPDGWRVVPQRRKNPKTGQYEEVPQ
jgi:hypothetical protein